MRKVAPSVVVFVLTVICPLIHAAEPWQVVRQVADFDRFDLMPPEAAYAVRKGGQVKAEGLCVTGGVECDIQVPQTGWYELLAEPEGGNNEFVIDGKLSVWAAGRTKAGGNDKLAKVDNLWLTKGPHTIRVQRYIWWGFHPSIRGIVLRQSDATLGKCLRVEYPHGPSEALVRKGDALRLVVHSAGRAQAARLTVQLKDRKSGQIDSAVAVDLPAGQEPAAIPVALPCKTEGTFQVHFADGPADIATSDLAPVTVHVVDTATVRGQGGELRQTLLQEIDCAAKAPDYVSGGDAKVVSTPAGKYRLSGDEGFLYAQHHNSKGSWFAYKIDTPDIGKPHMLEVTYPDDEDRTFLIVIRESSTDDYPVAGGVDSGGPWALSGKMLTHSILFWPKTTSPRVVFVPPHNGMRAAAASIRVYRVDGEIPPMDVPVAGGRTFLNWYEEGSNFTGFYGGTKGGIDAYLKSAEMWTRELAYMGGNMIVPTVAVYQMSMYPSRYNHHHAEMPTPDVLRLLLLKSEKFGLKVVPEFHPEARELDFPAPPAGQRKDNGLASKTGQVSSYDTHGPMQNPLHPRNQQWYLGMIGELVDRYKDSPALAGVSLRCMGWVNPSLNNFHSLDWGYDDLTVGLFEKETGTDVAAPPTGPDRFAKRYEWLMANAKQKWIDWRCEKIAQWHRRIVDRVRQARPDLRVYLTVFDLGIEAGLDPARLAAIDGLVLVNCRHAYGRQAATYEGYLADQVMRDKLLDPAELRSVCGQAAPAGFLFGARYFEATERVMKPADLGLPANTKETWVSGVVNPAGRACLERYAVALAETDAQILGDGGNAYTLGQPAVREFMREFRHLPAEAFKPRKDARDPVAVWESVHRGELLFYAVNRESYSVGVTISLDLANPGVAARRLGTGEQVKLDAGRLKLQLEPHQLLAFQVPSPASISGVATATPPEARAAVQAMVNALGKLGDDVAVGKAKLGDAGAAALKSAVAEARSCLTEGRLWRARTLLEDHRLAQAVYNPLLACPPGLERLLDPRVRKILRARDLPRPKDPLVYLAFDTLEAGAIPVAGKLTLQAKCEGPVELRAGRSGKAAWLDGKTARIVLAGPDAARLCPKDFTLSLWVNAESVADRRGIVMKQKWPAGYALFFWNGSVTAEAGGPDGTDQCRTPDSYCPAGAWHHLAVTVESDRAVTLYVDGEQAKRAEMKHATGASDGPFLIGWNGWGGRQNDQSPGPFVGLIDELRIWDRVLSADDILAEMAGK